MKLLFTSFSSLSNGSWSATGLAGGATFDKILTFSSLSNGSWSATSDLRDWFETEVVFQFPI